MTSNNLEAIELLKTCVERLQEQGFSSYGNTVSELNEAIDLLLQADEDIEVKEQAFRCICNDCPIHGKTTPYEKPTKETKLRELKKSILYGATEPGGGLMELISILLEEEY